MVVLGGTASLFKRHLHQEPVNLTWFGKGPCSCSRERAGGHMASAQAHTERSVTPQGEVWTDTQGEGHTDRGRDWAAAVTSSNSKDRGQPPEERTDSRDRFSLKAFRGACCRPLDITAASTTAAKCISVVSTTQFVAHYYNSVRKLTR